MPHTGNRDQVDSEGAAYRRLLEHYDLIDTLLGGTKAMREERETYLPREPKEPWNRYEIRLNRTFLYEALRDTVDRIVAKPFSRMISVSEDLPEPLQGIQDDVDRAGRDITQFGREFFRDAVAHGKSHLLVEFPSTGGLQSHEQEAEGEIRPYWVHLRARDVISWRAERGPNGALELTQVRWKETRVEPAGVYADQEVEYIRVLTAPVRPNEDGQTDEEVAGRSGVFQVWRKAEGDKDWVLADQGPHTFPGIPLVTLYTRRTALLEAAPPLLPLAWKNLEHWSRSSDFSHILHHAQVPILMRTGVSTEEQKKPFVLSAGRNYAVKDPAARMFWVEPQGGGLSAGRQALLDLQAQMEVLGLQPLVQRSGGVTATAKAIDEAKSDSEAQSWARGLENALLEAYEMSATWMGLEIPEEFSVDVFNEFGLSGTESAHLDALSKMAGMGKLSDETLWWEHKRRGVLSDSFDVEEEKARIELQGPPLQTMGLNDPDEEEEEDGVEEEGT